MHGASGTRGPAAGCRVEIPRDREWTEVGPRRAAKSTNSENGSTKTRRWRATPVRRRNIHVAPAAGPRPAHGRGTPRIGTDGFGPERERKRESESEREGLGHRSGVPNKYRKDHEYNSLCKKAPPRRRRRATSFPAAQASAAGAGSAAAGAAAAAAPSPSFLGPARGLFFFLGRGPRSFFAADTVRSPSEPRPGFPSSFATCESTGFRRGSRSRRGVPRLSRLRGVSTRQPRRRRAPAEYPRVDEGCLDRARRDEIHDRRFSRRRRRRLEGREPGPTTSARPRRTSASSVSCDSSVAKPKPRHSPVVLSAMTTHADLR